MRVDYGRKSFMQYKELSVQARSKRESMFNESVL